VTAHLRVAGVTARYGGVCALDDVSFDLQPGEIAGFIGPNGSGKTTLLDVISGQLAPAAGAVYVDGQDLRDHLPEDRARLGLFRSFQDCRLFPDLTVTETLLVGEDARAPAGVFSSAVRLPWARRSEARKSQAVHSVLGTLGLAPFGDNLVSELSTGTRRIVDLAIVLAARPRLLLLDEPTSGIAQREAEAFGPLLRRLHELTGATIVLVEHDVPLALSLCSRLFVMETGRIVSAGPPAQVMADPVSKAAYLGASEEALARSGLLPPLLANAAGPRRRQGPAPRRADGVPRTRPRSR